MKAKRPKLSTLVIKADKIMSQYIRRKYLTHEGYLKCVSCGQVKAFEVFDCGHFIKRDKFATRYVEENCHPECKGCNGFDIDHLIGYTEFMIDTYGRDKIAELKKESKRILSPSEKRTIVENALEYYTKKLDEL